MTDNIQTAAARLPILQLFSFSGGFTDE